MAQDASYSGRLGRRPFLQSAMAGLGALQLPDLLRLQTQAAAAGRPRRDTACILVWLDGGPSHLDTYDLKPEAPVEFRGPFRPIGTRVPGMDLCELLPRQAKLADKFTLIRSCSHSEADHMKGAQYMLTGRTSPGPNGLEPDVRYPDLSAIIKWAGPTGRSGLPSCVGVPRRHESAGAGYLGMAYEPFEVQANPNKADFEVPNLGLPATGTRRLRDRVELLRNFDALRRDLGQRELLEAMDSYDQEAVRLLTSDAARKAFNLKSVDPRERDRYGRSYVGQNLLLARRLVEAGITFVHADGRHYADVAPGIQSDWDDHAGFPSPIFDSMAKRLPWFDQAVSALIEDLYQRGLDQRVLVIVTGEFGRTPRIGTKENTQTKAMHVGREHWSQAMSMIVAGGGMNMGQVIGSTTARGHIPKDRPLRPGDLLATIYQHLGIDTTLEYHDRSGRPLPILSEGAPIAELVG